MEKKNGKLTGRYDTFVFDWDGTLNRMGSILWMKDHAKILFGLYGRTGSGHAPSGPVDIRGRIREEEIGSRFFSRLVDIKMVFSKVRMQEGAIEVLKLLKNKGKNVALFSDADSYIVLKGVGQHDVEKYFDIIVSTKMFKAPKPHPLGLLEILRLLGAKKDRTLYIGDTLLDYQAAKNAGVDFCAVCGGFDSYATFRKSGVKRIFRTIEELKRSL
jgi:HAD superfamily hydrolase (TIGR01549 family)